MQSLSFQTTRSVLYEEGATSKIGQIMSDRGCRKVAFITDAMILKLGLADAALDSLKAAGVEVWTFADVVADPPEDMILKAVAEAKEEGVDGVVSIGGGSSMDVAKVVAALLACQASASSRSVSSTVPSMRAARIAATLSLVLP